MEFLNLARAVRWKLLLYIGFRDQIVFKYKICMYIHRARVWHLATTIWLSSSLGRASAQDL